MPRSHPAHLGERSLRPRIPFQHSMNFHCHHLPPHGTCPSPSSFGPLVPPPPSAALPVSPWPRSALPASLLEPPYFPLRLWLVVRALVRHRLQHSRPSIFLQRPQLLQPRAW